MMKLRPFSTSVARSALDAVRERLSRIDPKERRRRAQRARRRKRALLAAGIAGGASLAALGARALMDPHRRARVTGALRGVPGRARGLAYRAMRRHPDEHVGDQVLADRVRSTLGPLEKRLDVPHVHVSTCEGVVALHGSVGTQGDADVLAGATQAIAGVRRVDSHLHVGLTSADTRPSEGKRRARLGAN